MIPSTKVIKGRDYTIIEKEISWNKVFTIPLVSSKKVWLIQKQFLILIGIITKNPQKVVAFASLPNGNTYYSSGVLNRIFKLRRIGIDKNRILHYPEEADWDS